MLKPACLHFFSFEIISSLIFPSFLNRVNTPDERYPQDFYFIIRYYIKGIIFTITEDQ